MASGKGFSTVNITIEGRRYPVKCTEEEAEELKNAEKRLLQQLNAYRLKYAQLDKQDCLSMALIEKELEAIGHKSSRVKNQCLEKLDYLQALLAQVIS